jgi:hypothetical protein
MDDLLAELANLKLSQPRHRPGQQQYGAGAGAGPPGARLSPFTSILSSIISHTHGRERRSVQHAPGHSFILQETRHPQIRLSRPTDICLCRAMHHPREERQIDKRELQEAVKYGERCQERLCLVKS